jgi:hypothetical protein
MMRARDRSSLTQGPLPMVGGTEAAHRPLYQVSEGVTRLGLVGVGQV